jgi:hypothetical protein
MLDSQQGYGNKPDIKQHTEMYSEKESKENVYRVLHDKGYTDAEIATVMSDETRKKYFKSSMVKTDLATKAAKGAGIGSAALGTIGAIVGVVAALGSTVPISVFGYQLAGPIAAGIAGIGSGVVTGGIVGALIGVGIPEREPALYESGVIKGKMVLGVHPHNDEDAEYFEELWKANRGTLIYS